jgi:hypothetical protein
MQWEGLSDEHQSLVRTPQIVAFALIMGVIVFGVVAVVVGMGKPPGESVLGYVAVVFTVTTLIARSIVPAAQVKAVRTELLASGAADESARVVSLLGAHQAKMIIEYALVEGTCFFVLIAYMTEGATWLLGLAGLLLAFMVLTFPTRTRIENFIRRQLELLELEQV